MNQGIVIASWHGGQQWLENCLNTLVGCKYPILVVINGAEKPHGWWSDLEWRKQWFDKDIHFHMYINPIDGYELGAIDAAMKTTRWDEVFFLQDSCEVKDQTLFDIVFEQYNGQSIQYGYKFNSYLGKFRREILDKVGIPYVDNKDLSLIYEGQFTNSYREADPGIVFLCPEFSDTNGIIEYPFGERRLKLENQYLIKYKSYWI